MQPTEPAPPPGYELCDSSGATTIAREVAVAALSKRVMANLLFLADRDLAVRHHGLARAGIARSDFVHLG